MLFLFSVVLNSATALYPFVQGNVVFLSHDVLPSQCPQTREYWVDTALVSVKRGLSVHAEQSVVQNLNDLS